MARYKCIIVTGQREVERTFDFVPVRSMYLELAFSGRMAPAGYLPDETVVIKVTRSQYVEKDQSWYIRGKEV